MGGLTQDKVTGLVVALNGKQNTIANNGLAVSKVTNLQSLLDSKQAVINDNSLPQTKVFNLVSSLAGKHPFINDNDLAISQTSGLQAALNSKQATVVDNSLQISHVYNLQNKLNISQPMLIPGQNVTIDSNNIIAAQFQDVKINDLSDCVSDISDFTNRMLIGTTEHGTLSNAINVSGSTNIAIGSRSLEYNTTGQGNVSVGIQSGTVNTTGENNTFIGKYSDSTTTYNNLSNATAIGYSAKVNTNNTIKLGNTAITHVKTVGKLTLGANEDITYTNTGGTANQFLKCDGAGNSAWADISENIAITNLQNGTDISFNNAAIELRSIKSFDVSGTLVDDITNLRNGIDISKNQIDYTTAYEEVTYQDSNSSNPNYIASTNNTNVVIALNNISAALATLATAVQALNDKYVIN